MTLPAPVAPAPDMADQLCPVCRGTRTLRIGNDERICDRCGGSGLGGALGEALARIARPDYARWIDHVGRAGGCEHPIRIRGEVTRVETATGVVVEQYSTDDAPDGVLYLPCNNRRASVCPACSERYRYDTYQLVAAGLRGGKGVPESVAEHPRVFATLTAPACGPVHAHRTGRNTKVLPCRPRRTHTLCPHGRPTWCMVRHGRDDSRLGHPLCAECFDYATAVLFNHHAGELWRYFTTYLPRELARLTGLPLTELRTLVKPAYVKVGEYQRRGLIHLHAVIRLDGTDGQAAAPPVGFTTRLLSAAVEAAVLRVTVVTATGHRLCFGDQLDIRPIRTGDPSDTTSLQAVAGYIGKYVTKTVDAPRVPDQRLTEADLDDLRCDDHHARLIRAAWDLGGLPCPTCADPARRAALRTAGQPCPGCDGTRRAYPRLRRWAHMLGFGGHVTTKSRRYSTTMTALRRARRDHQRAHRAGVPVDQLRDIDTDDTLTVIAHWQYAARGYRSAGDAWLALSAASRAREHRQAMRDLAKPF